MFVASFFEAIVVVIGFAFLTGFATIYKVSSMLGGPCGICVCMYHVCLSPPTHYR
jgi:hypothetical protein